MPKKLFPDLTRTEFMRRHWQKKPLLARAALPEYTNAVVRDDLVALAGRSDVESRIIRQISGRWQVQHGPFTHSAIARLPRSGWTLLVQSVDHVLPQAARLLREFSFIPYARLDDVMVSYAAPGGGVGPHFDSYDVFLVQGHGARRWQVGQQRDLELVDDSPVKILRNFRPEREWVLDPGDLLYLPPAWAHDGVGVDECITYSIGFRAPNAQELGSRFLEFLQDRMALSGMYADPDLKVTRTPGTIPPAMITGASSVLQKLRWSETDIAEFIGRDLTEPKTQVVFARPASTLTPEDFAKRAARKGLKLSLRTRMLTHGTRIFINGESHRCGPASARLLHRLADTRALAPPIRADARTRHLLYEWYGAGYITLDSAEPRGRSTFNR
ncbi:MAG: JmjC domain-containing protein [Burkholderiales bacterium]